MAISAATLRALIDGYLPYLHFAPGERFFPSDVDAWITNSIAEPWQPAGSHLSGTVVMTSPNTDTFPGGFPAQTNVMQGSHFPAGRRLRPSDLAELTGAAVAKLNAGDDVFLNFAGWPPRSGGRAAPDFTQGSPQRVYDHFSPLAVAVSGQPAASDVLQNPDNTIPAVVQGPTPTVFVEVDWAGRFTRLADLDAAAGEPGIFGPTNGMRDTLDKLIVFTYHYFYPLTDVPPPGGSTAPGPSVVQREGQWEAVSVFVRIDPDFSSTKPGPRTPDGLQVPVPDFADPGPTALPLLFLSYSFTGHADDVTPQSNVRLASASDVSWPQRPSPPPPDEFGVGVISSVGPVEPWRPAVFVTSGTHKNMFSPADVPTDVDLGPKSDLAGLSTGFGIAAGAASGIPNGGWIVGIFFALLALIFFVASQLDHDHTTTYAPTGPDDDFVPPAGPTTVPGFTNSVPVPTVRPFSLLPAAAGEETDAIFQPPPWSNFPGRWGLRVEPSSAVRWDNGMRFRDVNGRSRAFWNTLALYRWMNLPANASSAMTLLTP
jgi:hypothetical protein